MSAPCRHLWMPFADSVRIWQVCQKCHERREIGTHREILAENIAHIFREDEDR